MNGKIKKVITWLLILEVVFLGLAAPLFYMDYSLLGQALEKEEKSHNWALKLESYDKVKDEFAKLGGGGNKVKARFTGKDQAVDFISRVEQAGADLGTQFTLEAYEGKVDPKSSKSKKTEEKEIKDDELAFILKTQGSFSDFVKFLIRLENLDKYATIKRISLEKERIRVIGEAGAKEKDILSGEIIIAAKQ
ncbi:hypothetical protein KJ912_03985 [Patescibacteria group bacterium]|nr:hypothetical protein [Patescibacteria group bacterium]